MSKRRRRTVPPAPQAADDDIPPGLELRHMLEWEGLTIRRVVWSPDGALLAAAASDFTIRIWDRSRRTELPPLAGHTGGIAEMAWSPDGKSLASVSRDRTVRIWSLPGSPVILPLRGNFSEIAWHPDGTHIAVAGDEKGKSLRIWSLAAQRVVKEVNADNGCWGLTYSRDGGYLAYSSYNEVIVLKSRSLAPIQNLEHSQIINLQWSPEDQFIIAGSHAGPVYVIDWHTGRSIVSLQDAFFGVSALDISPDGALLASKSYDNHVRLVRCDTWEPVARLRERTDEQFKGGLAFHPSAPLLATLADNDAGIRIWELTPELPARDLTQQAVRHTAAKIVLVGEQGVGKSSLGWRLAHGEFKEQPSTHGQQFWILDSLRAARADRTACEAILWDLAGQPDYRLVHSLFLDDAELALLLFNPAERQDPMRGVEYWVRALSQPRARPRRVLLVGARADRGEPSLSRKEIEAFCASHGISGYVSTSAATGEGISLLVERMKELIAWDEMEMTVTTVTYKRIKDFVLALKENPDASEVLVDFAELRRRLTAADPDTLFDDDELKAAVNHLAAYGYVRRLRTASGEQRVLLRPELLNNVASSMVLEARRNPKELGALDEATLLSGGYDFPELRSLAKVDREVLTEAAEILFLEHNVCFRESVGSQVLLIFPELINLKKPPTAGGEHNEEGDTYVITGPVTNVYAALVVRLGYTNIFVRTEQWQDQAHYEIADGETCGFRLVAQREGELEIVLYYAPGVAEPDRRIFQGILERFLRSRPVKVVRFPPLTCDKCQYRQERAEVIRRVQEGREAMFCSDCGNRIALPQGTRTPSDAAEVGERVAQEQTTATLRTRFEAAQVQLLSYVRSQAGAAPPPSAFVSYAWGVQEHERWVERRLATDLRNAGVEVTLDRWHNSAIGEDLARFISRIESAENVIAVGTPLYREKYENKLSSAGSVVAAEVDLINLRLMGTEEQKRTLKPVLLDGSRDTSLPPLMRGRVCADFRDETQYFATLFDVILTLYQIPFDDRAVADLRESLRPDALPGPV